MTKDGNKKKLYIILSIVLIALLAVGTFFTIKIINNINTVNPSNPSNVNNNDDENDDSSDGDFKDTFPILDTESNISIDKMSSHKFNYLVTNLGEYSLKICIEDESIASIDNNLNITPKKIGSTRIVASINCTPQIIKYTTLTILDVVTDVSFSILNQDDTPANTIYVYNTYYLKITRNAKTNESYQIGYDDTYIEDLSLISKTENYIKYSFKVINYGEFNFKYISKYCNKNSQNIKAYIYPNNFEVSFNLPLIDNSINLYLFNNKYTKEANNDGIYNVALFNISTISNSNDNIQININNDCVILNNNQILANREGVSTITFVSTISNISKSYSINVSKVLPTAIMFNGEEKDIHGNSIINLELNTENDFNISIIPAYYYGDYAIEKDDGLIIENGKIILTESEDKNILIKYDNSTILNIIVKYCSDLKISKDIYYCSTKYTFENDTLTVAFEKDLEIHIYIEILGQNNTPNKDQTLLFNIESTDIAIPTNNSYTSKNNLIKLSVLNVGKTTINIYNNDLKISTTITLVVI